MSNKKKKLFAVLIMLFAAVALAALGLFIGSSGMSFSECLSALFGSGDETAIRIVRNIRAPRVLAAITAGAGLSAAGLVMQTSLGNPMASPSTLGVSNAAVFGANLSIIAFAGGFLQTGNKLANYAASANPFYTSVMAFIFAAVSALMILGLCRLRAFSPNVIVLSGIAAGSVWTAATTILQYYATDVGLSAAVIWSFGDLGRATYKTDLIMLFVIAAGIIFFSLIPWRLNALLSGAETAKSFGVNVEKLRAATLVIASVMTAVCVSFLGTIGFVGIICPHAAKKFVGEDHRFSLPASALCGSILLLSADIFSRLIGNGAALPVGAVTSLLGAPFFLILILSRKEKKNA